MWKSHDRLNAVNGKRLVLIADDESTNRALMELALQGEYDVVFAENGQETLDLMRQHKDELSLVLLDLMMPVLGGMDVLKQVKGDPDIGKIPIVVVTSDQKAEVECLLMGARDFIPKPYPQADVIKARVWRIIELSEDQQIISSTERDSLTGLYNREYFYSYANVIDVHRKETPMDAIVLDINHFHMINERFGATYGDKVLKSIADSLRDAVNDRGGIVCRREADTFMVYCPHGIDHDVILDNASAGLSSGARSDETRIWLRMGVYEDVDKSLSIERRFDRAKMAADTVQGSFTKRVGVYDNALHARELYFEQLIEDFSVAVKERQFQVFYQPKFDIQPEVPVLASAEALVRWQHPTLGFISPGDFIPLFEQNGLIQQLDMHVWREAAMQIKLWKQRFGFAVPISVNVSRIDMYDPHLVEELVSILEENELTPDELLLEITESAYTQDSEQIIRTVNALRDLGFKVEMDDFGTGYSSLNMISTLPIDALKLDMQFIRNAFSDRRDTRMLEVIVDIADYLSVPVIAEGVETEEQVAALREMGCDYVQGYFFSKPAPAEEYEKFIVERKRLMDENASGAMRDHGDSADGGHAAVGASDADGQIIDEERFEARRSSSVTYASIVQALAADYFSIYYVNTDTDDFIEYSSHEQYAELGIEKAGGDFFNLSRENIKRVIHPDDAEMFFATFTKENVMGELHSDKTFTLTYRLMFGSVPTYVHMKVTRMEDRDDPHIVIGVSNIDEQMRREQDYAQVLRMANQDALTGVKSKHAYTVEEGAIDVAITEGVQIPFAVAVCDVNDLKYVNDTFGHNAGDQYIKDACSIVCNVFRHSPVYRVGGDEFVAILRGGDYEIRDELMAKLAEQGQTNYSEGGVSIAGGLALFDADVDNNLADVFDRADAAMYHNKKTIKGTA